MGSMGGPVAINQLAIHSAMSLYDVESPQDCFEKVVMVSRHMIDRHNQKQKENKGA